MSAIRYTFLLMVSHYATDLQVTVMPQQTRLYASKGREEENYWHAKINVNNTSFKLLKKYMFLMHLAHLLDFKDTHIVSL